MVERADERMGVVLGHLIERRPVVHVDAPVVNVGFPSFQVVAFFFPFWILTRSHRCLLQIPGVGNFSVAKVSFWFVVMGFVAQIVRIYPVNSYWK
jgi:hypothetical protein